jgi:preprotein translocase subunit SecA
MSEQLIGDTVADACPPGTHVDDWDFDRLQASLQEQFNAKIVLERNDSIETIAEEAWGEIEKILVKREENLTTPFFLYFARHFLLGEIDEQWVDHLKAMEQLREGIGLRGYGQKDPKQEYKKEGFNLFREMMTNIMRNAAQKLFRVEIQREEEVPELQQKQRQLVAYHPGDGQAGAGASSQAAGAAGAGQSAGAAGAQAAAPAGGGGDKQQTVRRAEPKVGRNDPCPCGSGKKYKKCHGATASPEA